MAFEPDEDFRRSDYENRYIVPTFIVDVKAECRESFNQRIESVPAFSLVFFAAIAGDTERQKRASCKRLGRAKRLVSFKGLLGEAFLKRFPSRSGSRFLLVFLRRRSQAVSLAV